MPKVDNLLILLQGRKGNKAIQFLSFFTDSLCSYVCVTVCLSPTSGIYFEAYLWH